MQHHRMARFLAAIAAALPLAAQAALEPIPTESGFSGAIMLGAGWVEGENNLVAGNTFADILGGLEIPPDEDLDGDQTPDAWTFLGDYSASQITIE